MFLLAFKSGIFNDKHASYLQSIEQLDMINLVKITI